MKEYWTDTILESLVPAGTDVERGEPVRIYKADDVEELTKRIITKLSAMSCDLAWYGYYTDNEVEKLLAELEEIAEKDTTKIDRT